MGRVDAVCAGALVVAVREAVVVVMSSVSGFGASRSLHALADATSPHMCARHSSVLCLTLARMHAFPT